MKGLSFAAYLQIAVDTRGDGPPKMVGWIISSDETPTSTRGRMWLRVSESHSDRFARASANILRDIESGNPFVSWVKRLPCLSSGAKVGDVVSTRR
jgi:hypothetical protein